MKRIVFLLLILTSVAFADGLVLKQGHPNRYVVKPGDTLWGISAKFLTKPWRPAEDYIITFFGKEKAPMRKKKQKTSQKKKELNSTNTPSKTNYLK